MLTACSPEYLLEQKQALQKIFPERSEIARKLAWKRFIMKSFYESNRDYNLEPTRF